MASLGSRSSCSVSSFTSPSHGHQLLFPAVAGLPSCCHFAPSGGFQGRAQWTLMGYLAQLLGPAKTERIPGTPFKLRYVFLRLPLCPSCLKGQQVVKHCYSINFSFIFIFCGYLCAFNIPFSLLVRRLFNAFSHFYVTFLCSSFYSPWATVT